MGLNETMEILRRDLDSNLSKSESKPRCSTDCPLRVPPERDEPMIVADQQPTIRDLSTALYMLRQTPTCRNCIRRERGDCPSKAPMPKTCVSFQLNSKQMKTYGQQARNVITAWRKAIELHARRQYYCQLNRK